MNIALIGSGGREHALCDFLLKSKKVKKVICIPGNAGTARIAKNIKIDYLDFRLLLNEIKKNHIDLVVVGPEEPLVKGIADFLQKNKIRVFGPKKYAAQLEGSKAFMKTICRKNNIPTANFKICKKKGDVLSNLKKSKLPVVVKADGLAAGKGVSICKTYKQVVNICNQIFLGKFKSSKKLILEEFLEGEEVSYFLVVDKKSFAFMGSAQDHKRVYENEKGPNTGGMGAYSPAPIINKELENKIIKKIINPTLKELKKRRNAFTGFLYAGLMIKNNEPYLIEYNIRMGDPECQVILPRLKTELIDILNSAVNNRIDKLNIKWKNKKCMTIVVCSKGYPGNYPKGKIIKNLKKIKLDQNSIIFHAGTEYINKDFISNGGRVLNVTTTGYKFSEIRKKIIKIIRRLKWKHGFFRKDIGWRVI